MTTRPADGVGIKVCGITREDDARAAAAAGVDYLGLVFAQSPRRVALTTARRLVESTPSVRWVAVFAGAPAEEMLRVTEDLSLAIVQLHGDEDLDTLDRLRSAGLEVWKAVRLEGRHGWGTAERKVAELCGRADAVLLDRGTALRAGGGGIPFDWAAVPASVRSVLGSTRFVLAGGLEASNVLRGIELLQPDVVDVSSGVESSPGRKDPEKVRSFVRAARTPLTPAKA